MSARASRALRALTVREIVRLVLLPALILAVGIIGFVVLKRQQEVPAGPPKEEAVPLVKTVPALRHDGGLEIEVDGVVVPYREIELAAEVDGRIVHKAEVCRAGQYVERDTLLIRIDPQDYQLEVDRLTEELNQANGALEELKVQTANTESLLELAAEELKLMENEYRRVGRLHADEMASDSELETAARSSLQARNAKLTLESQLRLLKTQQSRTEAAAKRAGVLLEKAELDLKRTEIRSPKDTDGVVVRDLVEQDDYVRKGSPLVSVEDTTHVEVKCSLRVDELCWLWCQAGAGAAAGGEAAPRARYEIPRTPVTVIYRLEDRRYAWDGVLSRYDGLGLDESTRTVPCRVLVEAPREVRVLGEAAPAAASIGPRALVRGMFVTVRIHAKPQAELLRVEEAAVRPGDRVWVLRNGKLKVFDASVIRVVDGWAILQAGQLKAGDRVVKTPPAAAVKDMTVREQTEESS